MDELDEIIEELALNYKHRNCEPDCIAGSVYRDYKARLTQLIEKEKLEAAKQAEKDLLLRIRAKSDYMKAGGLTLNVDATVWNELEQRGFYELNDDYELKSQLRREE